MSVSTDSDLIDIGTHFLEDEEDSGGQSKSDDRSMDNENWMNSQKSDSPTRLLLHSPPTLTSSVLPPDLSSPVSYVFSQSHDEASSSVDVGSAGDAGHFVLNQYVETSNIIADDNKRYCWVCFATDEDDMNAQWVKPCRCRGTTKWVHQACIQRWIDEKQKGNTTARVSCPQCNTDYNIFYPAQGSLVVIMDSLDALISRVCPFIAAGLVVGSIYWTAVTYGAVTVMQVAGHKEGLYIMEQSDPLVLLVGLPTIPVLLILSKMIRWEDQVLRFIRKHSWRIPLLRHILPPLKAPSLVEQSVRQDLPPLSDPVSATRILCGALLFPSISTALGRIFFENVRSNFKRAILGGVAFVTIKGVLRLYHKQQQYTRSFERKILDFKNEEGNGSSCQHNH